MRGGWGVKGTTPLQLEKPKIILIKHHKNTSTNSDHEDDSMILSLTYLLLELTQKNRSLTVVAAYKRIVLLSLQN